MTFCHRSWHRGRNQRDKTWFNSVFIWRKANFLQQTIDLKSYHDKAWSLFWYNFNSKTFKIFFLNPERLAIPSNFFFEPRATRDLSKKIFLNPEPFAICPKIFFWTQSGSRFLQNIFFEPEPFAKHPKNFFWTKTGSRFIQNIFFEPKPIRNRFKINLTAPKWHSNHSKTIGLRVVKFGKELNSLVVYNWQKAIITAVPQHLRSIIFVVSNRNIVGRSTWPGF